MKKSRRNPKEEIIRRRLIRNRRQHKSVRVVLSAIADNPLGDQRFGLHPE